MHNRKILKWIGIGLVVVWLIFTINAYYQHRISDEVYVVSTYVEFENYGLLVKDVEIYDYEISYNNEHYDVFNWLPQNIAYKVFRIMSFYARSTTSLENGAEYVVNCEIISEEGNEFDMQEQDLRIVMYETLPVEDYPQIGRGLESNDIDNIVKYDYEGKWFDKDYQGLSLKDYNTGEVRVIPFGEPIITKTYTFSNPKNHQYHSSASDQWESFIYMYNYNSKEAALEYIYQGEGAGIDWSLLEGISGDVVSRYELSYESNNVDLGVVFNLLIETENDQAFTFEMIYDDEKWWILDFEKN